ncbi:hypothetical protein GF386_06760 [Candidatus Pacearchaeota archaeon]|nr:hypothetical protein [Candidatus Pacearchaeota archaeon]MBD3283787.1 hypothetical protein [Candidatus Pacearchaeota archaeon]
MKKRKKQGKGAVLPKLLLSLAALVVLIVSFYLITSAITKYTGFVVSDVESVNEDLILCLEEQDITVYINSANSAESLKELQIGNYLDSAEIINCADNNIECSGMDFFPTYIINDQIIVGDLTEKDLAELSGCG